MQKPERHIWEEGSTHRAVAGKEYDEVWDYADNLEAQLASLRDYKQEVEEVADLMYQYTMKRLNEASEDA